MLPHLERAKDEAQHTQLSQHLGQLNLEIEALETDQQTYHQPLQSVSAQIHPFELETQQWLMATEIPAAIKSDLKKLASLANRYGTDKTHQAIATFR